MAVKAFGPVIGVAGKARTGPYAAKGGAAAGAARGPDGEEEFPVYVGNLAFEVKWQELKDHMRQAGDVKNARVLTNEQGKSKGSGIATFGSKVDADTAVATLNGSELMGRAIVVDEWTDSGKPKPNGAAMKGQGPAAWGGVQDMKPGDWMCAMCGHHNFARNTSCRQCGAAPPGCFSFGKGGCGPAGGKALGMGKGLGKGGVKGGGKGLDVRGENLIYVGNLAFKTTWKELKDHMGQAGTVEFSKVLTEDGTDFGRSKGTGCVRYSDDTDLDSVIAMLNETELMGRNILVDRWTTKA